VSSLFLSFLLPSSSQNVRDRSSGPVGGGFAVRLGARLGKGQAQFTRALERDPPYNFQIQHPYSLEEVAEFEALVLLSISGIRDSNPLDFLIFRTQA
jgi:hypothetical protein